MEKSQAFWETNFVMSYIVAMLLLLDIPTTVLAALPPNLSFGTFDTFELYKIAATLLAYSLFCGMLPISRREHQRRKKEYQKYLQSRFTSGGVHRFFFEKYKTLQTVILYSIPVSLMLIRFDPISTLISSGPNWLTSVASSFIARSTVYVITSALIVIPVSQAILVWFTDFFTGFMEGPYFPYIDDE